MHTPTFHGAGAVTRAPAAVNAGSVVRIVWQAALPKDCGKAKVVLACLAWHAVLNEADQCWPHVDTIARLCGLQRRATLNHLEALAKAGLITSTKRPGTSNLYRLNRDALIALSSEQPTAPHADRGAENAADRAENATCGAENDKVGAENARNLSFFAPIRKKEGKEKEEGREMEESVHAMDAASADEPTLPPLLDFDLEDLKTPEQAPAPIAGLVTTPPAAPAAEPRAVAIAPETLAAVNAQRAANGKTALARADLVELGRQATLAGMAPQAAAEWILAKPTRSFFKAEWLLDKAGAAAAPAPIDETARAQAKARAEQVQAELLRASIAAMCRDDGIVLPPSATRPVPQRSVTVRSAAPVSVGEGGPANTRRNAEQWLSDYAAGRPFKAHQFDFALRITGRSRDELVAQRAAAKSALAAATGGAA